IDLNRASVTELQEIPGIGPTRAQHIVDERAQAPFKFVDDLERVMGIKSQLIDKARPYVTVGGAQPPLSPQHLIVDKAQVITCALVVSNGGSDTVQLAGYPSSVHGNLLRGKGQPLFSLDEADDIRRAFPALWSEPTAEQITESWVALAAGNMLPGA